MAEVQEWADGLVEVGELIGARFARSEPRANALEYVRGLLSHEERKNSWTLSERAGHKVPDRMQRLLSTTDWDPDGLRDDLRSYVAGKLGDTDGVLVDDETGFLKKGQRLGRVQRDHLAGGRIVSAGGPDPGIPDGLYQGYSRDTCN